MAQAALALLLAVALFLPCAAHADGLYYARAIGQEYLPEAKPGGLPRGDAAAVPELPALGDRAAVEPEPRQMSTWTKVLIGVVLVAAVAALGDGDGGSAQMNVTPGATPAATPPGSPPAAGGGGASGGGGPSEPLPGAGDNGGNDGGIIDIDLGDGDFGADFGDRDNDGNRGRGRGRERGRGRD